MIGEISQVSELIQGFSSSDVEPAGFQRYSSQLQLRSGLGMLPVCVLARDPENRILDFLAFLHECSPL